MTVVVPPECWVTRSTETFCADFVGGQFANGSSFTAGMVCLPCQIRTAVKAVSDLLDDADQFVDSPSRPNNVRVEAVRRALEPLGVRPHRWKAGEGCPTCGRERDFREPIHHKEGFGLCPESYHFPDLRRDAPR